MLTPPHAIALRSDLHHTVSHPILPPCLLLCLLQVLVPSSFVGLILEDCNLPFPDHGHVILADPSPILFYRIASNEVRCLVDIPADRRMPSVASGDMAAYLTTHVLPQVRGRERGSRSEG